MKSKLAKIEKSLQALIEGSAARLFASHARQQDLASQLVSAMQAGIRKQEDGVFQAPNLYTLWLHPDQAPLLRENQALLDGLAYTLQTAGDEAGFVFPGLPVVRVASDSKLLAGQVKVQAQNSQAGLPQTTDLPALRVEEGEELPVNAFLIVNGVQIFPLHQSVINIGRRADNQLVIDDKRVSRVHAQLRAVRNRYVIFDLDSTGGTFVNGERVHQSPLYPGDVVSLSGVPLVYGQDPTSSGETGEYSSGSGTIQYKPPANP